MDIDDLDLHVGDDNRLVEPVALLQIWPNIPTGRLYVNYSTYTTILDSTVRLTKRLESTVFHILVNISATLHALTPNKNQHVLLSIQINVVPIPRQQVTFM